MGSAASFKLNPRIDEKTTVVGGERRKRHADNANEIIIRRRRQRQLKAINWRISPSCQRVVARGFSLAMEDVCDCETAADVEER